ncbi:MAG: YhcN/YlaJ family sporulation lipoprotein [Psychrobacillus sp.]
MIKKMKILIAILIIGFLTACGNDDAKDDKTTNTTTDTTQDGNMDSNATVDTGNDGEIGEEGKDVSTNGDQKVDVADEVAAKIAELDEVDAAHVLVTDKNAYVAVRAKEGTEDNEELKTRISEKAKESKGNLNFENVYVSLDPDFVGRMEEYGTKIKAGEPVEGFFDEFTDTVKRVFPDTAK